MAAHTFKLGIFLNELQLPLDEGLEEANELGVEFVWFSQLPGKSLIADLSDAEADDVQRRIEAAGLEHMKVSAGSPFKFLDLTEVTVDTLEDHEEFKADFRAMVRSMQLANRFGVGAVSVYSFAWPGEYTADKPTWPMRWMTRGGIISDLEMDKLDQSIHAYGRAGRKAQRRPRPVHDAVELHEHDRQLPPGGRAHRVRPHQGHVGRGGQLQLRGERRVHPWLHEHRALRLRTARQRPARQRRREARLRLPSLRRGRYRLPHDLSECSRQRSRPLQFRSRPTGHRKAATASKRCGRRSRTSRPYWTRSTTKRLRERVFKIP